MPHEVKKLLLVAQSARAMAASACRGGYASYVIDLFQDFDMNSMAIESKNACAENALCFDEARLLRAAESFAQKQWDGLIFGSGFENDLSLFEKLAADKKLYGNAPDVIRRVKSPTEFFTLLDQIGMPHPETQCKAPSDSRNWLVKTIGGAGGNHVRHAQNVAANEEHYFQRFEAGRNLSVLFLANGKHAHVIGFNEQQLAPTSDAPFRYGGAVNHTPLAETVRADITQKLDGLVAATGLVGLNGIDFILRDNEYFVLELNPRPTATMELYDTDFPRGLLHWHIAACGGHLPNDVSREKTIRGHAIVFGSNALNVPPRFAFPDWCADFPYGGSFVTKDAPLCSVQASGDSHERVTRLLDQRRRDIQSMLQEQAA